MKVGKASSWAKFGCCYTDSWYGSLLLCILTDTGSENRRLLILRLGLVLSLGRGTL